MGSRVSFAMDFAPWGKKPKLRIHCRLEHPIWDLFTQSENLIRTLDIPDHRKNALIIRRRLRGDTSQSLKTSYISPFEFQYMSIYS